MKPSGRNQLRTTTAGRSHPARRLLGTQWLLLGLSILLIGAAPTTLDPRPDPQACQLLTNLDLEPLLFAGSGGVLDSWDAHPAPGLSTCRWEGRPRNRRADAPPRVVTLAFYHLTDAQEAQRQLDRQPQGSDRSPSPAMTNHGDDAIVRSSDTVIVARHGADLAVLDAHGAELAEPTQPEVRYLLDALALKAVGAMVKLPPWAAPGQTAKWVPLAKRSDNGAADVNWQPSANPGASVSAAIQWLLHLTILVLRHGFAMVFVGILGPVVVGALLTRTNPHAVRRGGMALGISLVIALVGNLVFGTALASRLLYRFGTAAAATITGTYGTSTQYNNHDVVGYHVLLRSSGGQAIATSFEDDDFNVYPPHNATRYPSPGDVFTVRYLRRFPHDFAIIADDGSPWALAGRCASLIDAMAQAKQRAAFTRATGDRAAALAANRAVEAAGCPHDR